MGRRSWLKTLGVASAGPIVGAATEIVTDQDTSQVIPINGSAGLDPGESTERGLVFSENFERPGWEENWHDTFRFQKYRNRYYRSTDHAVTGNWSLEVEFPEDEHYGCNASYIPTHVEDREVLASAVWAQFWVYFSDPFVSSENEHKLPGLKDTRNDYGHGGKVPEAEDGKRGWSMRASFSSADGDSIAIHDYTYWLDMEGPFGDSHGEIRVPTGEWHRISQYVRMNTPGNYDGLLHLGVNGEPVVERTDMRWRESSDIGVHAWWFNAWYGGNGTSPITQSLWFDELQVIPLFGKNTQRTGTELPI